MHAPHESHFDPALTAPPALSQGDRESCQARSVGGRRSFTLTELMVVIGIIVLLVGLLLVALGQVQKKSRRTRTESTMQQFANACMEFQSVHAFYPGVIPDEVISANPDTSCGMPLPLISSIENALVHLLGGYRVLSPQDPPGGAVATDYNNFKLAAQASQSDVEIIFGTSGWKLIVDTRKIGEGPVIDGKPYAPYFTPNSTDLVVARYPHPNSCDPTNAIPEIVDAWGVPILYLRQLRTRGPLLVDNVTAGAPRPQFDFFGSRVYTPSCGLGELGQSQVAEKWDFCGDPPPPLPNPDVSIFNILSTDEQNRFLAACLAHQAMYKSPNGNPSGNPLYSNARGAFLLISAGQDGVYFSRTDGPGSASDWIDSGNVDAKIINVGPKAIDQFDDIRVYGGG